MEKEELKVYLFEVTRDKKAEEGQPPCGRESPVAEYAFTGDPKPRVDYNRYWDHGDGCLNLVAKDGHCVDGELNTALNLVGDYNFRPQISTIVKLVETLEKPGKWFELTAGDERNTKLRVTRLQGLPEIDVEATRRNSDLNVMQMWAVRIDGQPLFDEGGTINGRGSLHTTTVFRPKLLQELGRYWEELIAHRKDGLEVAVTVVEDSSADSTVRTMRIAAKTREELNRALNAVGVLRPDEVDPDVVVGQGDAPTTFVANVRLTDVIS